MLFLQFIAQSQSFEVTVDTTDIKIKEFMKPAVRASLTHAVEFNDRYYCFFRETHLYHFGHTKHFFILEKDGTIKHNLKVPKGIDDAVYFDLFVNNDSILTKAYMGDNETYYLDLESLEWIKIEELDDILYEDEKFYVTHISFGEWGNTTWFRDKKTGKEHELGFAGTIVNNIDDSYYITSLSKVLKIEDPLKMKPSRKYYYYDVVKNNDSPAMPGSFWEGSNSLEGTEILYEDTTYIPYWQAPQVRIVTSFTYDNNLFHLCVDSTSTYIAKIDNGNLKPIKKIGENYSIFNWFYSYRNKVQKNGSQLLKFRTEDANLFGFIKIHQNNINIRYLSHDIDTVKHIGTDNFAEFFSFIYLNFDYLHLDTIDFLEKEIGGTDMELFLEDSKQYLKVEDSIIANKTRYYYAKNDSLVKSIFLEWTETENYNESSASFFNRQNSNIESKLNDKINYLEQFLTSTIGTQPSKELRPNNIYFKRWEAKNGLIVSLEGSDFKRLKRIRMRIYKE